MSADEPAPIRVLRRARAHLARVGLHRGSFFADPSDPMESPCCLVGALKAASGSPLSPIYGPFTTAARMLAREARVGWPAEFSDRHTLPDVLELIDRTIARAA